jgi:TatD DNase family protein
VHIEAAKRTNKALIVHTREAREDTLAMLKSEQAGPGVFHCFTEDYDMAKKGLDLGFYISFSGIVTFKNAEMLKEVAKKVPLDRILVETDAPYLTPVPFRGKANQPGYTRYVAEYIAELKNLRYEEVARATTQNFEKLFKVEVRSSS